ncbi:hypothetical protein D6D03_03607 [Aureobasidium pullulans]|nr:hypothetical protein D6D03_03607 [Aureobasidium pullulans]
MRSRHLARPRDSLTLALATTCSQSPSPCAITIANTANTATTTTPPHSLRSIYSHHRRRAPSILEPSLRVSHLRLCAPRKPHSVANGTIALSPILHDAPLTLCASSNMLYPREDKETNQLIFQCRNCQWPTAVGPTCIYRNEVSHNLRETAGVVTDVASDPTLPHVERDCENPRCGGRDAVFFQSQQRNSETGMKLFYVCCECGKTST